MMIDFQVQLHENRSLSAGATCIVMQNYDKCETGCKTRHKYAQIFAIEQKYGKYMGHNV